MSRSRIDPATRARLDSDAFIADVARRYEHRMGRLATSILGNPSWAEDVVADVLLAVWRRSGKMEIEHLEAYLFRSVINRAIRYSRRQLLLLNPIDYGGQFEEDASRATENRQLCRQFLAKLAPKDRAIIGLKYLMDFDDKQVAGMLGVPIGTVKSRHSRALARLRRGLVEESKL